VAQGVDGEKILLLLGGVCASYAIAQVPNKGADPAIVELKILKKTKVLSHLEAQTEAQITPQNCLKLSISLNSTQLLY
jgi:hypothetical protein